MKRSILGISEHNLGLDNIERLYQEGLIDSKDYARWKNGNGVLIFLDSGVVYISNTMFEGVCTYMLKTSIAFCYFSVSRYSGIHSSDECIFSTCVDIVGRTKAYSIDYNSDLEYSRVGTFTEIVKPNQTLIDAFKLKEKLTESTSEFSSNAIRLNTINLIKLELPKKPNVNRNVSEQPKKNDTDGHVNVTKDEDEDEDFNMGLYDDEDSDDDDDDDDTDSDNPYNGFY